MSRKQIIALWVGIALFALPGCSHSPPTAAQPPSLDGTDEADETAAVRAQVKQAVRDYARQNYPQSTVKGVWAGMLSKPNSGYFASADLETAGRTRRINLVVRRFSTADNTLYWQADRLTPLIEGVYGNSPPSPVSSADDADAQPDPRE